MGCFSGFLLLEWPLPWPSDLSEIPEIAPVTEVLAASGVRLQGLVPSAGDGLRRVISYRWPPATDGRAARYERSEVAVDPSDTVTAALELLGAAPGAPGGPRRGHTADLPDEEVVDVLVCTHGRRDRCCGSLGTALAQELAGDDRPLGDGVRVWRTSHTGGHRFAATAIVLPHGTAWAFADTDALRRVVTRTGELGDLLPRYRGCAGMGSRAVQALERAVLGEVGWPLFDRPRSGAELGGGLTELSVSDQSGTVTWEASVRVQREAPVPECGLPIEMATKSEPELVVEGLRRR